MTRAVTRGGARRGRLSAAGPDVRLLAPSRRTPQTATSLSGMGPVRTCVGCRTTGPRSALLRVVVVTDAAGFPAMVVDEGRSMPGRGAWLHPDPGCLETAERRRALGRALRNAALLDVSDVRRHVEAHQGEDDTGQIPAS